MAAYGLIVVYDRAVDGNISTQTCLGDSMNFLSICRFGLSSVRMPRVTTPRILSVVEIRRTPPR